jgi:hypothetical protein
MGEMKKLVVVFSAILLSSMASGCYKAAPISKMPDIPVAYYACISVNQDDLEKNYFSHYGNLDASEQAFNGAIFVFKNIKINQFMKVDKNTLNVSTIQCVAMVPGSVSALKLGEYYDVVGVCDGPLPNSTQYATAGVYGWLLFTGCIFVPSGTVDLPASGGPGVVLPY